MLAAEGSDVGHLLRITYRNALKLEGRKNPGRSL
jgi:hypothetical protein